MLRIGILSILMGIASIYTADSIELLANYKLWKSVSTELAYDSSGHSRHARLVYNFVVTDRGLASIDKYNIRLMTYGFLSLEEYIISFWMLCFGVTSYMRLFFYQDWNNHFGIRYVFGSQTRLQIYIIDSQSGNDTIIPKIEGWNLNTIKINKNESSPGTFNINLYLNLNHIYTTSIDSGFANFDIIRIGLSMQDSSTTSGIIANEVWIHTGFSDISDLNYLISDSNSSPCGCEYKCPTHSNQECLQAYGEAYNKYGQSCDTLCTSSSLSCDSPPSNCILKSKDECLYGLYDRESLECIFYCPHNSCICPTLVDFPVNYLLSCSCKAGFKKVSENSPACISDRCLEYHPVGYKYVCDNIEYGYMLDNAGDCCICISGFTQVQSSPLICVSICIDHIISGNDYTCSSCAEGYTIDDEGKCNICNTGYVNVLDNPYTCIMNIDNCIEYIYEHTVWKCLKCGVGYFLFEVSINNLICARAINSCADYNLEGISPVCNACEAGFYLSESKNECLILNCLSYRIDEDKYYCSECSIEYQTDSDGRCNQCSDNYQRISEDPFTCMPKIEHCSSYHQFEGGYICEECEVGLKLGSTGLCDECEDGFILIPSESLKCAAGISNCLDYEKNGETLRCMKCKEGYAIDLNHECTLCNDKYIHHPQDSSVCIRKPPHCLKYELSQDTMVCIECEVEYVSVSGTCYPKINLCSKYIAEEEKVYCSECSNDAMLDCGSTCSFSNKCICKYGFYISSNESCEACPGNCKNCEIESNNLICLDCETGYNLINFKCIIPETSQISESTEIALAEANRAAQGTAVASGSVSMLSLNINSILSMIGIIQILNYILLYNINIPPRTRVILEGISFFSLPANIFEYFIPNDESLDIERYKRVDIKNELFLINAGNMLTTLIAIILLILILKVFNRYSSRLEDSNIIKKIIQKLLKTHVWNFLIGYLIQGSLELTIFSLINIYHVSLSNAHSTIGLIISVIILLLISPITIFLYLLRNYEKIRDDELDSKLSVLHENLSTTNIQGILFNNLLLIRRIVYGISIILLYSSPFMQVVVNSSFSFAICHYILFFKPFDTSLNNVMNFYIEFLTFLILSIIGAFIKEDLSSDIYVFADWSLVVLIYSIIMVPAIINLIISIKDLIIYIKTRCRLNIDGQSVTRENN